MVGDAWGIDAAVVAECNKFNMAAAVWGIARYPRNGGAQTGTYSQLSGTYTQRDQHMIHLADVGRSSGMAAAQARIAPKNDGRTAWQNDLSAYLQWMIFSAKPDE